MWLPVVAKSMDFAEPDARRNGSVSPSAPIVPPCVRPIHRPQKVLLRTPPPNEVVIYNGRTAVFDNFSVTGARGSRKVLLQFHRSLSNLRRFIARDAGWHVSC